jgi:hypothetical protein
MKRRTSGQRWVVLPQSENIIESAATDRHGPVAAKFNCKVGRSYPSPALKCEFSEFLHRVKREAFNLAIAIVFLSWLSKAVWHEVGLNKLFCRRRNGEYC